MSSIYQRGDVLLADVVFSGGLGSKSRPVVVLSTDVFNQAGIKLIVAGITSNLAPPARPGDVMIDHWIAAGLVFPSAVRGLVITIDRSDVRRTLGVMSASDLTAIEQGVAGIMGLTVPWQN